MLRASLLQKKTSLEGPSTIEETKLRGQSLLVVADVGGDGILDVVTSNWDTRDLSLLTGRGDGTLASADDVAFPADDIARL